MKPHAALFAFLLFCADGLAQPADAVPKLLEALKSKDAEKRSDALVALGELGPKAAPAMEALAAMLPGVWEEDRILATLALGKIGKASLPAVEKFLAHEDETTRFYALWVIGLVGKDAKALTPRVLEMYRKEKDAEVRIKSMQALARIGADDPGVRDVFFKLAEKTDDLSDERQTALEELRYFGADALAPLSKALQAKVVMFGVSEKPHNAFHHLLDENKTDAFAQKALPHVVVLLTHTPPGGFPEMESKGDGLAWLIDKHGAQLLPPLTKQLADKDAAKARSAAGALGQMYSILHRRSDNPELQEKLAAILLPHFRSSDHAMRHVIAMQVPWTKHTKTGYEQLMFDVDATVRFQVISRAQDDGIDLVKKLQDEFKTAQGDLRVRYALILLPLFGEQDVQKVLKEGLDVKDPALRLSVATTIPGEPKARPILVAALKSKDPNHRRVAAQALTSVPAHLEKDLPTLLECLADDTPDVRMFILSAMQNCAHADPKASLAKIVPYLSDADPVVQSSALAALSTLGKEAVPHLAKCAEHDKGPHLWEQACMHLMHRGREAKDAVPALLRVAENEKRWQMASATLMRIDPDASYPALLEILRKRDAIVRKTLDQPRETQNDPKKLVAAILQAWPKREGEANRDLIHTVSQLLAILPPGAQYSATLASGKQLSGQLAKAKKALASKKVEDRLDALESTGKLQKLWFAISNTAVVPDKQQQQEWNDFMTRFYEYQLQFATIYSTGRADADLQVRRLARRLETQEMSPFQRGVPFFGIPIP